MMDARTKFAVEQLVKYARKPLAGKEFQENREAVLQRRILRIQELATIVANRLEDLSETLTLEKQL